MEQETNFALPQNNSILAKPVVSQFIRFVGIGFLNTAVDFLVLNIIAAFFHSYKGVQVGGITVISFSIATLHSYLWNKYWAFSKGVAGGVMQSLGRFITAAVVGGGVIGLVLVGAGLSFGAWYYLLLIAALAIIEFVMWKAFHLRTTSAETTARSYGQFMLFILVSLGGVLINFSILSAVTSYVPPQFGINQQLWTNLIKAGATGIALFWNFVGYKIFVFKR